MFLSPSIRTGCRNILYALIALAVSSESAGAAIGFRRVTPLDHLIDPVRFPLPAGYSFATWDTTSTDTTRSAADSARTDSTGVLPDSTYLTSDTTDLPPVRKAPVPTDSTAHKGTKAVELRDEGKPEKTEEPPPYHTTNIFKTDLPIDEKTAVDTASGLIYVTPTWGKEDILWKSAFDVETYLQRATALSDREIWQTKVKAKLPQGEKPSEGIVISIPALPKTLTVTRIFGGSNVGLTVNGNISIDGGFSWDKRNEQKNDRGNTTDKNFKINQKQQFSIKGKVGEKVSVEVDQDSEKLFDFENSLKVRYIGDEDEIVQSVQAGNVDLSLPGSSLATASANHKGLFGFKTETKVGPLKMTAIASLDKGEKAVQTMSGGAQTSAPKTIEPTSYVTGRYFFLDSTYRENYRHYDAGMDHVIVQNLAPEVVNINVWKSVPNRLEENDASIPGVALANPDTLRPIRSTEINGQEQVQGNFILLKEGSDYTVDRQLGYIRLSRSVQYTEVLAVAYDTKPDAFHPRLQYGDLDATNHDPNRPFILKLLQPKNQQPEDIETWSLMWRNVYDLGANDVNPDGFNLKILRTSGQTGGGSDFGMDARGASRSYLAIFGLDQFSTGGGGPDGKVDYKFVDFAQGEFHFPDLTPFDPQGWIVHSGPGQADTIVGALNSVDIQPEVYTEVGTKLQQLISVFNIETQYASIASSYQLGFGVLEGSEEVTLNGRRLNRGSDYSIEYGSGYLTVLNRDALSPGANLEIRYERGQAFQLDTQTLLGMRAQYEFWDNSWLGATVLRLNKKTLETRVRVGGEPTSNTVLSLGTSLNFKPEFLTRAIDMIPLIDTDKPSDVTFSAEVARVIPSPNPLNSPSTGDNSGVAYIDDFESVKRSTPLGISRRGWTPSSFPEYDSPGADAWKRHRGRMIWYNPTPVKIKEIWPERETEAQNSTAEVLEIRYQPWWAEWARSDLRPVGLNNDSLKTCWGGVMRYLGAGYADQSQAKFLEIWLDRERESQGSIYIDLGKISEDVIPDGKLQTEDKPRPGFATGDGYADNSEDIGYDARKGADPTDSLAVNGPSEPQLPSYDDWASGSSGDYSRINGTEGNGTSSPSDEGGRIPDTEDISGDGFLDQTNDFYRYRIDLSQGDFNRYIVGGLGNSSGWRLYRIPLTDTLAVGKPSYTNFDYARIWLTGFDRRATVRIAQMEIVGNEWRESRVADGRGGRIENLSVAVINSHDNKEYKTEQPPGVSGEVDQVSGLQQKEQSLVIKLDRLGTGESSYIFKVIGSGQKMNLMEYRKLKMFVHGGGADAGSQSIINTLNLQFFLRLGTSGNITQDTAKALQYYEYSERLTGGWIGNTIDVDLNRLAELKFVREQDSTRGYNILADGDVIRVEGSPSLRDVKFIQVGVRNLGRPITTADNVEVWVDELRVSDVIADPGMAATGKLHIAAADLFTIDANLTQQQAQFHNVSSRLAADPTDQLSGTVSGSFQLDNFIDPTVGIQLPLTYNYRQDVGIPRYKPNSDILLATGADNSGLWNRFSKDLFSTARFRTPSSQESRLDSMVSTTKSYTLDLRYSKTKRSDFWPVHYFVDPIGWHLNYQESFKRNYNSLLDYARGRDASGQYELSIDKPYSLKWLGWAADWPLLGRLAESEFRPLPSHYTLSGGLEENVNNSERRHGKPTYSNTLSLTRSLGTQWDPFEILGFGFRQETGATRIGEDSTRMIIARRFSKVKKSDFVHNNVLDSAAYLTALDADARNVQDDIFWKFFGQRFVDFNFTQDFNATFRPQLLTWLGTESSYRVRYGWRWGQNFGVGDKSVGADGTFSSSVVFRLTQFTSSWRGGAGGGKGLPGDGIDNGKSPFDSPGGMDFGDLGPGVPGGFSDEEAAPGPGPKPKLPDNLLMGDSLKFGGMKLDSTGVDSVRADSLQKTAPAKPKLKAPELLPLLKDIASRLRDIQWNYSHTNNMSNRNVGGGQADWLYRLGFSNDPGLDTVAGYRRMDVLTQRDEHRFTSGFEISKNLSVSSMEYQYTTSRTVSQSENGTRQSSVFQYFAPNGIDVKKLPFVNYTLRWGGWEQIALVKDYASSIVLENGFRGSATEQWQRVNPDSAEKITSIEYEKSFQPLASMTISWKGGVGTTIRYNWSTQVSDQRVGKSKSRNTNGTLVLTASYTSNTGFAIPIWPFKNHRFRNTTTFSLNASGSNQKRESSANNGPFSESSKTSAWSISPQIDYSFSTSVHGGFRYTYSYQSSKLSTNTSQELGFNVNISLRG